MTRLGCLTWPRSLRARLTGLSRTVIATPAGSERESEAGLTLIEMIVALALGALVVAFLAEGTGLLRHFARIGQAVSAQDEILATRDHLRRTVESAMRSSGGLQQNNFAGVGDTVVFTAPGDRLLETGGPVRITLAAVSEGTRMSLVETRAAPQPTDPKSRTRRLVSGADRVAFSYYGSMSGGSTATWAAEWTDPGSSPSLIRIDVVFSAGDRRRWAPFLVFMPSGGSPEAHEPAAATHVAGPGKP